MLVAERDDARIRSGLERWLGRPAGEITRPRPGWSCETIVVERELVIRLPPVGDGIFPSYDLAQQAAVQEAAASFGVPVASPVTYEPDESYLGARFIAMPFVDGPIPGEFTAADTWLHSLADDDARHALWRNFFAVVALIHTVPTGHLALRTGLEAELEFWERYVSWATDGSPPSTLKDALGWCRSNHPESEPECGLLWGDARLGNVIFDPSALAPRAVLDWDMVSSGPIEMDLGWFLALEQLQSDLAGAAVPGFGSSEEAVALIEKGVGRPLADLGWYEVFALVRAGAVSTRIAILFERAGRKSVFDVGNDPTLTAAARRIDAR